MIKCYTLGIFLFISFIFCGCKSTEYITVPVEKTKIEYRYLKDSVYLHDSVLVNIYLKGDTVYTDRYKFKIKEVYKTDTIHRIDSIPTVVTVDRIKEVNKLYFWQEGLMYIGGVGIITLIILIFIKLKSWKLLF